MKKSAIDKKRSKRFVVVCGSVVLFGMAAIALYFFVYTPSLKIENGIADELTDPAGDDYGYGELSYPENKQRDGSLDLLRYMVHEPVQNSGKSKQKNYWQIDMEFENGTAETERNIRIYIDADGDGKGATQTKMDFAEGVEFDSEIPWDFVVSAQNGAGTLLSYNTGLTVPLTVTGYQSGKEITIIIPLEEKELQKIYSAKTTWHYVCVGAYQADGRDGFGSAKDSEFIPKLYDILVPPGQEQETVLSAWDEDSFIIPVLKPVMVNMEAANRKNIGRDQQAVDIAAERERLLELRGRLEAAPADVNIIEKILNIEVMQLNMIVEALEFARANEAFIGNSMMAQIYIAVAESKMAGLEKNVIEKGVWVNKGMANFDRIHKLWPLNETVYTYQVITYSNFPSVLGAYRQVLDLLSYMREQYASNAWELTAGQADRLWTVLLNLEDKYPRGAKNKEIRAFAMDLKNSFPIMASRPGADEAAL
ncbi:MAG: hypothetical protein LBC53_03200 [Spirochaetaceae bacterium]|jgi:hypothetical protein|nr:hypothetical protein [Spirochaetaceae bacterium]